nr:hypothetical protein [Tanacetum cinerariifolium]
LIGFKTSQHVEIEPYLGEAARERVCSHGGSKSLLKNTGRPDRGENGEFFELGNEIKKGHDKWGGDQGCNHGGVIMPLRSKEVATSLLTRVCVAAVKPQ